MVCRPLLTRLMTKSFLLVSLSSVGFYLQLLGFLSSDINYNRFPLCVFLFQLLLLSDPLRMLLASFHLVFVLLVVCYPRKLKIRTCSLGVLLRFRMLLLYLDIFCFFLFVNIFCRCIGAHSGQLLGWVSSISKSFPEIVRVFECLVPPCPSYVYVI